MHTVDGGLCGLASLVLFVRTILSISEFCLVYFLTWEVSLCNSGWLGICYVSQGGLEPNCNFKMYLLFLK